jgi:hypothetical protein
VYPTALVAGLAILLASCGAHPCPDDDRLGRVAFTGGAELSVRIADEDDERATGLMGETDLPPNEGMVFIFGSPTQDTFWMKDTLLPLSIAFVDGAGRIVTIADMEPCAAEPCPTYGATEPYVTAVETNQGWFRANGVDVGDEMRWIDGPFCS